MTYLTDRLGSTALAVSIAGQPVTLGRLATVTLHHGRQGAEDQPDAATCQLTCYGDAVTTLPAVGQTVTVNLGASAGPALGLAGSAWTAAAPRFVGTVTDVQAAPGAAGVNGPGILSVTAVGPKARLGRTIVGDTPWPAERDGARASRILALAAAAAGVTVGTVDPGTVDVLGRDVDAQPALALLDELAQQAGGVMASRRDGTLEYHDAEHRRNVAALATLTAANVLAAAKWAQGLAGLVNDLTMAYGPTDPQDTVRVTDPQSITAYGPLAASIATQLTDATQAGIRAADAVGRRSRPRWRVDALTVDVLRTLTTAQAAALAQLEVGSLLSVTGFPMTGPFVTARLYVEGWTETWSDAGWSLELAVTEYGLTGPTPRWADVPVGFTWAGTPDMTWLAAAGWYAGEPAGGRWLDESAGEQWTEVGTVRTWATS